MMITIDPFLRTKLAYLTLEYISVKRSELLGDLVSYTNDPVRRDRRYRMLTELSLYEINTLRKIQNFESDNKDDFSEVVLNRFKKEIESITNIDA
jgi:hypothetical protein